MPLERANDPVAFREFLDAKLSNGAQGSTLEELLNLWEIENASEEEKEETLRAIRRGLDDMYAGRTVDAFESAERLRLKLESVAKR